MMMALFPTLKGAARPITTPITTYHHIKHAPATSHKNQVNSLYMIALEPGTHELDVYAYAYTVHKLFDFYYSQNVSF